MLTKRLAGGILFCLILGGGAHRAEAATLSFSNATGTVGQTVSVSVLVSAQNGESLNGVSARVYYPTDKLSLVSMSKSGSIITFWAEEPSFSNSSGTASLEGIVPNPGYSGQGGRVITLVFRVVSPGTAAISFGNASVLANDGRGTNILTNAYSRTLTLNAAPVSTPTPATSKPTPPRQTSPSIKPQTPPSVISTTTNSVESASTTSSEVLAATENAAFTPTKTAIQVGRGIVLLLAAVGLAAMALAAYLLLTRLIQEERRRNILVRRSFSLLKKDLVDHIRELRKTGSTLSKKEADFLEQFEQDLDEVEQLAEKRRLP